MGSGCGSSQEKAAPEQNPDADAKPDYTVRVTPTEFFAGELKRIRPLLDYTSAVCFKVKIDGNVRCRPDIEMWHDGNRVDLQKYLFAVDDHSDEIALTVRELAPDKQGRVHYQAAVTGQCEFARILEKPTLREPLKVAFGPGPIEQPIDLKPGSDSAIVWAMGGGHGLDLRDPQDKQEEQLKALPWAMVLRLGVEKKDR
jgi:hypothetical protein